MKLHRKLLAGLLISTSCGCATTTPPPLAYLSLQKPHGIIQTMKPQDIEMYFSRGGWYAMNQNFRPAADIESYLYQSQERTNSTVLRNVDIKLDVPFALDILFFGYNRGTDTLTVKADTSRPTLVKE